MNYVNVLIVLIKCQLSLLFTGDFTLETQCYLSLQFGSYSILVLCATAFMKISQTRLLAEFVLVLRVIFTLLSEAEWHCFLIIPSIYLFAFHC